MWDALDSLNLNLLIRSYLNGALLPLFSNLALIISIFLWSAWQEGRAKGKQWQSIRGVPTGCFLWWISMAESLRSGAVWVLLRFAYERESLPYWVMALSNLCFVSAGIMLIGALLRGTYIFTPPPWKKWYWIYSALSALSFLALSQF